MSLDISDIVLPKKGELVFALVAPVGADYKMVAKTLAAYLESFDYTPHIIQASNLIKRTHSFLDLSEAELISEHDDIDRINNRMTQGNDVREALQDPAAIASLVTAYIESLRFDQGAVDVHGRANFLQRSAFIISVLKTPQEVNRLRLHYGSGFYAIGIHQNRERRRSHLQRHHPSRDKSDIDILISRDESEGSVFGQNTRKAFELCDAFINFTDEGDEGWRDNLHRIISLVFGDPHNAPTFEEICMFHAFCESLRSSDLSRQVGAVIARISPYRELISVGCNEVPKFLGGQYNCSDIPKFRDVDRKEDANQKKKDEILDKIIEIANVGRKIPMTREDLKSTGIPDLTEWNRAVHAEMEAIMACARNGISPRGASLFSTTYPCHNCAKHIVNVGVTEVYYIQPYPKSLVTDLYPGEISYDKEVNGMVNFKPFFGVGPRRFFDLFSMNLSLGRAWVRKDRDGNKMDWPEDDHYPRIPAIPASYLDREYESNQRLVQKLEKISGKEVQLIDLGLLLE